MRAKPTMTDTELKIWQSKMRHIIAEDGYGQYTICNGRWWAQQDVKGRWYLRRAFKNYDYQLAGCWVL